MKAIQILLLLCVVGTTAGCIEHTEYGKCVGVDDDDIRDTKLVYKISTWNAIVGIVFVETILIPAWVLLDTLYCPVAEKK